MRIFADRPLAAACTAMLAAAVVCFFLPLAGKIILAAAIFVSLCAAVAYCRHTRRACLFPVLILCLALLGTVQSVLHFHVRDRVPQGVVDTACAVECTVLEEGSAGGGYAYYTVRVTSLNGVPTRFKAALECGYTSTFHVGDRIALQADARSLDAYYDHESRLYAIADGIRLGLISEDATTATLRASHHMPWRETLRHWQHMLTSRLLTLTGKHEGGLAAALFLGDRAPLDAGITTAFRRAGVSHLLALSGMHVTILMTMLAGLTAAVGIPKKGRLVLLCAMALLYLSLTGFRPSAIRAVGMILLLYLGEMLGTRTDPLTTLCTVGALMLACSPATVADGGFWMSFCAVFGLVTVLPVFNDWLNTKRISSRISRLLQAVAASAVAVVSVSLLNCIFCGEISLVGIPLTVLLTPVLTATLCLIPLTLLIDVLPLLSARPLAHLLSLLLELMTDLTAHVSYIPNLSLSLQYPFALPILALMSIALLCLLMLPLRRKLLLAVPPVAAVLAFAVCLQVWIHFTYDTQLQASYVVRSSGSALVITDESGTTVIDTSSGSYAMLRDAQRAVTAHADTEIDTLILTHYHRAFVYSTERLAKRLRVHCVLVPLPRTEGEYHMLTAMRDRLRPLHTELMCYEDGQPLTLARDAVFVRDAATALSRSAQPIVTYRVQTDAETLLLTQPAVQESAYAETAAQLIAQSDILILCKDGPRIKTPLTLAPSTAPRLLLTDSAALIAHLDLSPDSPLYHIPHVTDITRYRFRIQK